MTQLAILTASRNDSNLLESFLNELLEVLEKASITKNTVLYFVDDLSVDQTQEILKKWIDTNQLKIVLIPLDTNLGNQGAMAYGLKQVKLPEDALLLTLDSDGEDNLQKIPELLELAKKNKDKVVFTERGQRMDPLHIRLLYRLYRFLFLRITGKKIIPNNFMIVPAKYLCAIQKAPFVAVYYALAVLRLGIPYTSVCYDRRKRFFGHSSQNMYNLMSHGLVGLMMFYETVIPKILTYLLFSIFFFVGTSCFALFVKFVREASIPGWTAMFIAINFGFIIFSGGLIIIMGTFAINFKLGNYYLFERQNTVKQINEVR